MLSVILARVAAAVAEEDDKSGKQMSKYHKRGEDSKTDSSDSDANWLWLPLLSTSLLLSA